MIFIEIKIPKEIQNYHETIFFGLTTRQFFCSLLAVGAAVGLYFACGSVGAGLACILSSVLATGAPTVDPTASAVTAVRSPICARAFPLLVL